MLDKATAVTIADAAERGMGLAMTIRYLDMFHWSAESEAHHKARAVEPDPRLESVADHTWHMCYLITLLLPYFPQLDAARVLQLAVLHDILELITGDYDPTGSDGLGTDAHSMDATKATAKSAAEQQALEHYLAGLPAEAATLHRDVLTEEMNGGSDAARFVKVVDKMQTLIYSGAKKKGELTDGALQFFYRYRAKTLPKFPALAPLYDELYGRLVSSSATARGIDDSALWAIIEAQASAA